MGHIVLKTFLIYLFIESSIQQFTLISFNSSGIVDQLNCASNQIYDISKLECKKCPNNSIPFDRFNCRCVRNFYFTFNSGGDSIKCEPCERNQTQSLDGFSCIEPPVSVSCPTGFLTDTDIYGTRLQRQECILCDSNYTNPSQDSCKSCKPFIFPETSSQSILNATCNLNSNGGFLFFQSPITIPQITLLSYFNNAGESWLFKEYALAALRTCRLPDRRNMTSCQFLANMCVLKLYSSQSLLEEYLKLYVQNDTNPVPWLTFDFDLQNYRNEYLLNGLDSEYLKIKLEDKKCKSTQLEVLSAEYNMWGGFKKFGTLDLSTLDLCNFNTRFKQSDLSLFTTNRYINKCNVDVQSLFELSDSTETVLYDLYLRFQNGTITLPIPIRIKESNKGFDDKIYRRFFLFETTSSKKSSNDQGLFIRFAKRVKIKIELVPGKSNGEIFPPIIEVEYDTAKRDDKKLVELSFEIEFIMDTKSYQSSFFIIFGVLAAVAFIWSCLGIWNWNRRSFRFTIDIITIFKFLMFLIGSIGNAIFLGLLSIGIYWFLVYRSQTNVVLFLPNSTQEKNFSNFLIIAFVLKLLDVLYLILVQTSYDIFFIDWERPKVEQKQIELKTLLPSINSKDNESKIIMEQIRDQNKISCWRTLFVANEWNELQTFRKINSTLQLVLVLFLLKVVNLESFTRQDCGNNLNRDENEYAAPFSFILRLGIAGLVYLVVEVFQLGLYMLIYSRCVEDKIGQFVDFCSVSNISMLIMTHTQYGYYIHGRSPHGHSDTSMFQMTQALIREENDASARRGLENNTDHQTFSIKIPSKLRKEYSKVMSPLYLKRSVNRAVKRDMVTSSNEFEKRMLAYTQLNNFLISFFNNSLRTMNYTVVTRNLFENIFNIEFKQPDKNGYLYRDDLECFTEALYFGKEKTLFIFEALLFLLIDYASQSYVLAALIVYIVTKLLKVIRSDLGKRNLSKKTLVDKRFLI